MIVLSTNVERLLLFLIIGGYLITSNCYKLIERPILRRGSKRGLIEKFKRRRVICKGSSDTLDNNSDKEKRLKVLCLHGYLSNSILFELQLRRLIDEAESTTDFGKKLYYDFVTVCAELP
jgi:hypothetical protein